MHHCHNNLLGTTIKFVGRAPGVRRRARRVPDRRRQRERHAALRDRAHAQRATSPGPSTSRRRRTRSCGSGCRRSGAAGSRSSASRSRRTIPARLFRAWTWVHMDARCLVYPRPRRRAGRCPRARAPGSAAGRDHGDADFAGLRAAAPGDPPQRIAWKAYARNDVLLLKQFAGGDRRAVPARLGRAARPRAGGAAVATRALVSRRGAAKGAASGCACPASSLPLGTGPQHLGACLEALALFEATPR